MEKIIERKIEEVLARNKEDEHVLDECAKLVISARCRLDNGNLNPRSAFRDHGSKKQKNEISYGIEIDLQNTEIDALRASIVEYLQKVLEICGRMSVDYTAVIRMQNNVVLSPLDEAGGLTDINDTEVNEALCSKKASLIIQLSRRSLSAVVPFE